MTVYLMEGPGETERLTLKTETVLARRHLAFAGLQPGESLVDFGCGSGEVVMEAARISGAGAIVGIDVHGGRTAHAAAASRARGLTNTEFHRAEVTGAGSTGLPAAVFDHAWARFLVEYHPDPIGLVREMARVVRPGGHVTLIDIEGNGVRHFGMSESLRAELDEVVAGLASTGFDPDAGAKLARYAEAAGLVDVRHELEPYHRVVGTPDARTAEAWRRKLHGLRDNYVSRLFPERADKRWVFDAFLDFILREDTMTWSVLHLVRATRP